LTSQLVEEDHLDRLEPTMIIDFLSKRRKNSSLYAHHVVALMLVTGLRQC